MQPLLLSVRDSEDLGQAVWRRTGKDVLYFKNHYTRERKQEEDEDGTTTTTEEEGKRRQLRHQTASFTIVFPHTGDVCYLAYHYPYTYTRLMVRNQRRIFKVPIYGSTYYNIRLPFPGSTFSSGFTLRPVRMSTCARTSSAGPPGVTWCPC